MTILLKDGERGKGGKGKRGKGGRREKRGEGGGWGKGGRRGERGEGGGKRANISGLLNFATASPRTFSEIHSSIKFQSNNTSEYIYI